MSKYNIAQEQQGAPIDLSPSKDNIEISFEIDELIIREGEINISKIDDFFDGIFDRGNTIVLWNGLDNQGSQVGGGIYICQLLVNGSHVKSQKMTLLK